MIEKYTTTLQRLGRYYWVQKKSLWMFYKYKKKLVFKKKSNT